MDEISSQEVIIAAQSLKNKRVSGHDVLPTEFWKAICREDTRACKLAVLLCNRVWQHVDVPEAWHNGLVTAIFKKGDESSCENYRPISPLEFGYKLFASILLRRLRGAGAEDRIWMTQMGFRNNRGTGDAIFVARRLIEHAWATHDGSLLLLSLDWAKASDSVAPGAPVKALQRCGIPMHFCRVVQAVYSHTRFQVRVDGQMSSTRCQEHGISQGCPLSPFLFSILMTVLLYDANMDLRSRGANAEVLSRENHRMLSKILQHRHIMLLKRVADLPSEDAMRKCVFQSDSFNLLGIQGSR